MSVEIPISLISIRRIQQLNEEDFELRREIEFHEEKIEEHQNKLKKIRENLEYNRVERELHKKLANRESDELPGPSFRIGKPIKEVKDLSKTGIYRKRS
ncbi:hypothetical protein [Paenibacillus larvae]|uniref:hypothetical protein n=1 Tax=Paenibacillus larvae TaxID=1464 RepID=UPI00288FF8B6|nr:hypothetical protein [Paenibacillus larvae]MDT2192874.1 hypothetical protein [Paenibacillus larvae]MDT2236109.1 hypothetical protein [Paenibacillus larvae]MDT2286794.1 hypothetical protein [Paenibacillus larvae]